jgi:hypothetical protein
MRILPEIVEDSILSFRNALLLFGGRPWNYFVVPLEFLKAVHEARKHCSLEQQTSA